METLITVVHVIVAVFMILVVLIQGGNQGGMSAAFGGGNSQGFFGATGATTILGKLTYGAAAIFMVTSIWLTVLKGVGGNMGLSEKLKAAGKPEASQQVPLDQTSPSSPAASTSAPDASKGLESGMNGSNKIDPASPSAKSTPSTNDGTVPVKQSTDVK